MKHASLTTLATVTLFVLACGGAETPELPAEPTPVQVPEPEPEPESEPAGRAGLPLTVEGYGYVDGKPVRYSIPEPGSTVYTTRKVPLLDAPGGSTVQTLDGGSAVTVVDVGRSVEQRELVNAWVEVDAEGKRGHVFGGWLTPLFEDHEGDMEEPHQWTVSWAPDFTPRITILIDGVPRETLDLQVTERAGGGTLAATSEPWGDFGNRIDVTQCVVGEAPSDGPRCVTGSAIFEGDLKALTQPDAWRFEPEEGPAGSCGADYTTQRLGDRPRLAETVAPTYLRGEGGGADCNAVARVTEGPAKGKRLVACSEASGGKGEPSELLTTWFLELAAGRWARFGCLGRAAELETQLARAGVKVVDGGELADFIPKGDAGPWPGELWAGARGTATFVRHVPGPALGDEVWRHPELGPVYRDKTGDCSLKVPRAEGGHLVYAVDVPLDQPELRGAPSEQRYFSGAPFEPCFFEPDIGPDPEVIGTSEVGPILAVGGPALESWKNKLRDWNTGERAELGQDPLIAVPAPFGGYHVALRMDLAYASPFMAEPILYAYAPEPTAIDIRFGDGLRVEHTQPETTTGWTVVADRTGWLEHEGEKVPRLFWDGRSTSFPAPEQGWVVPGDTVEDHLRAVLPGLGLRGREVDEALEAWLPTVAGAPWVRVGVHPPEDVARYAPLDIVPAPDTLIRVLVELRPLERPEPLAAPSWSTPDRTGLVVVEWGYVIRADNAGSLR